MSEIQLEQARMELPYVRVFYYGDDYSGSDSVSATLGGSKLQITQFDAEQVSQGTDYYILLDITASISTSYFEHMKEAVLQFQQGMRSEDTITIIAYGDEITVIADHAGTSDSISDAVNALVNDNYTTHFWEALTKTANLADSEANRLTRAVALVMTDGQDCSTHESTEQEALTTLREAGVPLYAMAVRETASGADNAFLDDLKDFVREANGQTWIFGEDEAVTCITECQAYFQSVHELDFLASSNRIEAEELQLTVLSPDQESSTLTVYPKYYQADTTAPTAILEKISEKELRISYSEAVLNADTANNFTVTKNGEALAFYTLYYDSSDGYYTVLTFETELTNGTYEVTFRNITDGSVEENQLTEAALLEVTDAPEIETETETEKETESETETETETESETETEVLAETAGNGMVFYGAIGGGVFLFILILVLLLRRRHRNDVPETATLEEEELHFDVVGETGSKKLTCPANCKIVAGRSSRCDIVLEDDTKMVSNRHFSVERVDGSFYVTDLESTNGTKVNGMKITSRCKLKNGDVVQAGPLKIIITW
ncbi:MAG: FHA domain-containing protein [Lachnospiraceae bacterium]|nr:FHA domain-containing protein [Lachnospiraceae bacterium]